MEANLFNRPKVCALGDYVETTSAKIVISPTYLCTIEFMFKTTMNHIWTNVVDFVSIHVNGNEGRPNLSH